MKKGVDKRGMVWYSNKAVAEVRARRTAEKKLKNLEKKQLTNSGGYVILTKMLQSNADRESKTSEKSA